MKNFATLLFMTAYMAYDVEAGDNACYFHKNKDQCEKISPGGDKRYKLDKSSDSDCECKCIWDAGKANCDDGFEFVKSTKTEKKGKAKIKPCGCEAIPCDKTCVEMNENADATAVEADYVQGIAPACECTPADPAMQCDAKYAGMWANDADGNSCTPEETGEGEGDGTEAGASTLAAAALALGTVLLF